jgi:hypothetical protein
MEEAMRFVSLVLGLIIIFVIPYSAAAEEPVGSMKGVVYKKNGQEPFKDCKVVLERVEKDKDKQEQRKREYESEPTDDMGEYVLPDIPEGVYKVRLIRPSGKKSRKSLTVVNIVAGQTIERSFYIRPKKIFAGYYEPCVGFILLFGLVLLL